MEEAGLAVQYHCDLLAMLCCENVVEQCGFPRAQVACISVSEVERQAVSDRAVETGQRQKYSFTSVLSFVQFSSRADLPHCGASLHEQASGEQHRKPAKHIFLPVMIVIGTFFVNGVVVIGRSLVALMRSGGDSSSKSLMADKTAILWQCLKR